MENVIEIIYKKQPKILKINCGDRLFDVSKIEHLPLEQWMFPFFTQGTQWNGLYEELKSFVGSESFILRLDSDEESFAAVKHALADMPVKLVGTNNVVTIIYNEDPVTTKMVVNGRAVDIALIQNRYIDEWIRPFQVRGIQWEGIFTEIEKNLGTDKYTLYFVGSQKFMSLLMENCPDNISVFYRNAEMANEAFRRRPSAEKADSTSFGTKSDTMSNPTPEIKLERNFAAAGKTLKSMTQSAGSAGQKDSFKYHQLVIACAAAAFIFLLLPFANFSTEPVETILGVGVLDSTVTGYECIFGIDDIEIVRDRSFYAVFMALIPILLIAANYIKQMEPYQKWIAVGAPALGIVCEIITVLDVRKIYQTFVDGEKIRILPQIGGLLILLAYLLVIVAGLFRYYDLESQLRNMNRKSGG